MSDLIVKQENPIDVPGLRAEIAHLENLCRAIPDEHRIDTLDVMNHFTDGVYCRTVLMHAGELIVGKIHKREHIVVVSAGRASVVSEEFGAKEIIAPAVFKSPPGVKRVLFIHEDMIWTTIHKNSSNTEDLDKLEGELIAKEYDDVEEAP